MSDLHQVSEAKSLGDAFNGAAQNFDAIPCKPPPMKDPRNPTAEDIVEQLRQRPPCPSVPTTPRP